MKYHLLLRFLMTLFIWFFVIFIMAVAIFFLLECSRFIGLVVISYSLILIL
jgi:hypothetical protein